MGKNLEKSLKKDEYLFKIIKKNLKKLKIIILIFNVIISKKKYFMDDKIKIYFLFT